MISFITSLSKEQILSDPLSSWIFLVFPLNAQITRYIIANLITQCTFWDPALSRINPLAEIRDFLLDYP